MESIFIGEILKEIKFATSSFTSAPLYPFRPQHRRASFRSTLVTRITARTAGSSIAFKAPSPAISTSIRCLELATAFSTHPRDRAETGETPSLPKPFARELAVREVDNDKSR
jgi:hypothetical protein